MANAPGPREQQLRQMRGAKIGTAKAAVRGKDPSRELAEMTAAAIGHPPLNASADAAAQPKETTMATASKKAPKKSKAKKPAASARRKPAKLAGKAVQRAAHAGAVIRPGSKLALIVGLLTRSGGCTTADILAATGWPAVSVPQMAKSAGLTLKKTKEKGSPTRYSA